MTMSWRLCAPLLIVILSGCDDGQKEVETVQLRQTSMDNMVSIPGGRFQMGDFGPLVEDKLPYSLDLSTKPLHWVSLSDFKMGKYRVTWEEFNRWLDLQGREPIEFYTKGKNSEVVNWDELGDDYPAQVSWQDAKAYCQWLGTNNDKKIDLPTEAQWEYAARSGGQFLIFGNSDNKLYHGQDPKQNFTSWLAPVGSFSPNPIGLYDMMGNGTDWVNDWYSEDYYQYSPEDNPQGPENGTKRVVRGYRGSVDGTLTITRGGKLPDHKFGTGFRCVENP
ncbi:MULTISPECIES: formylglycine-generating enzyme family protein [Providencia]|uniref:formylglycine-generating enzyme family protein n=1 Tax=Providencia TaxID=586 RepID=UPI000938C020|nr:MULTISPECIES: SUMF1/EgtB/PvdO family nonheme iron enzyme [Providencia]MBP6123045.1 SUMF1/EgtB/PvdO family nonheme iron enzyme [Providencia sp.]NIH24084.1 formylglycine-generating enzyme family protein [Providencia heimbachae]